MSQATDDSLMPITTVGHINGTDVVPYDESFLNKIREFEKALLDKHIKISQQTTQRSEIKKIKIGKNIFDYVDESFMRDQLNKFFPLWSWEPTGNRVQMIGEWLVADGVLTVYDNGIKRKFYSGGAARIQFTKDQPHTAANIIDLDNIVASAITNAFKRAVNRLCNIADDIYRKGIKPLATKESIKKLHDILNTPGFPDEKRNATLKAMKDRGEAFTEEEALLFIERCNQFC